MRTYPDEARRSSSVSAVIGDALTLLHQDIAEYGFAGLVGAIGAAFATLMLPAAGGIVGQALIAPSVFIIALITYANTCAAIRRVQDNLEPDAIHAFFAVLARLPALLVPLTLPIALSGASVLAGVVAARWAPVSVVTLAAIVAFALAGLSSFQRSLYVPALFARDTTVSEARLKGGAAMREASALVSVCFTIALAAPALMALAALSAGFGALSTAAAAFVLVAFMPLASAIASLIYEGVAPQIASQPSAAPARRTAPANPTAERLRRHVR